jgi:hypothetical protein
MVPVRLCQGIGTVMRIDAKKNRPESIEAGPQIGFLAILIWFPGRRFCEAHCRNHRTLFDVNKLNRPRKNERPKKENGKSLESIVVGNQQKSLIETALY